MSHICGTFFFMTDKRPDSFAENAKLLPYGSNVGAPPIKPTNITAFKMTSVDKVNKVYNKKFNELVEQMESLRESFTITQEVYDSNYKFEPIIGEIYHLYEDSNSGRTLSLIEPNLWNQKHLYSVILNSDMTWTKIE